MATGVAAQRALGTDVIANAEAAAFRDPRFPPLTAAEWPQTQTEDSLLSAVKTIRFADEAELLERFTPREDGLPADTRIERCRVLRYRVIKRKQSDFTVQ